MATYSNGPSSDELRPDEPIKGFTGTRENVRENEHILNCDDDDDDDDVPAIK
jgi:hypothetical protein